MGIRGAYDLLAGDGKVTRNAWEALKLSTFIYDLWCTKGLMNTSHTIFSSSFFFKLLFSLFLYSDDVEHAYGIPWMLSLIK